MLMKPVRYRSVPHHTKQTRNAYPIEDIMKRKRERTAVKYRMTSGIANDNPQWHNSSKKAYYNIANKLILCSLLAKQSAFDALADLVLEDLCFLLLKGFPISLGFELIREDRRHNFRLLHVIHGGWFR